MAIPIPSDTASTLTSTFTGSSTVISTETNSPPAAQSPIYEKLPPTVGPIPLAALIPMCFFSPFIIGFTIWLLYTYTIKRWKNKRRMQQEAKVKDPEVDTRRDVELQVQGFVNAPPPARTRLQRGHRPPNLQSVSEERTTTSLPQPARAVSPLRKEWSEFRFDAL